ncbi:MAG: outer membrane protein assembly factor BamD [Bacteroidetes bacterium]|nr:outer membrane protein assembly factor BamD [Bacteroidota bacterium]
MLANLRNFLFILTFGVLLVSCTGYEKAMRSKDVNYKLAKANAFYDKKQWLHANSLYETLLPVMRHTRNYEPVLYRYAYSFYNLKDYLSASYHFKNFVEEFPNNKESEEMEYLYGYCLYKLSPKSSLDQSNTERAMEALQSFINTHPDSKYAVDANKYIDESRLKLETKEADAAKLYYNIGQYKSATIYYRQVMREYPESTNSDFYQYMIVKSWYKLAMASYKEKQEERFANALSAYQELVDGYPKSKYLRDAEKYYTLSDKSIKKLRNEHK